MKQKKRNKRIYKEGDDLIFDGLLSPLKQPADYEQVKGIINKAKCGAYSDTGTILDNLDHQISVAKYKYRLDRHLLHQINDFEEALEMAREVYDSGNFKRLSYVMFILGMITHSLTMDPFIEAGISTTINSYKGKKAADKRFDKAREFAIETALDRWEKNVKPVPRLGQVVDDILRGMNANLKALGLDFLPTKQTVKNWIKESGITIPKEALDRGRPPKK